VRVRSPLHAIVKRSSHPLVATPITIVHRPSMSMFASDTLAMVPNDARRSLLASVSATQIIATINTTPVFHRLQAGSCEAGLGGRRRKTVACTNRRSDTKSFHDIDNSGSRVILRTTAGNL